jgi:hypothetical protein
MEFELATNPHSPHLLHNQLDQTGPRGILMKQVRGCQCNTIFRTRENLDSLLSDEGLRVDWDISAGARDCRLCAHILDIHRRYPIYKQVQKQFLQRDKPYLKALCFQADEDSGAHPEASLMRYLYIDGLVDVAYSQALISIHSGRSHDFRIPSCRF